MCRLSGTLLEIPSIRLAFTGIILHLRFSAKVVCHYSKSKFLAERDGKDLPEAEGVHRLSGIFK
jgi:hypothetical protein